MFFNLLLDIAGFLSKRLQSVLVICVLGLELCNSA